MVPSQRGVEQLRDSAKLEDTLLSDARAETSVEIECLGNRGTLEGGKTGRRRRRRRRWRVILLGQEGKLENMGTRTGSLSCDGGLSP